MQDRWIRIVVAICSAIVTYFKNKSLPAAVTCLCVPTTVSSIRLGLWWVAAKLTMPNEWTQESSQLKLQLLAIIAVWGEQDKICSSSVKLDFNVMGSAEVWNDFDR